MATNAYSPYPPQVLGDAWVPILDEGYIPTITEERGYWFNLTATSTIITARTYMDITQGYTPSTVTTPNTNSGINIYPAGGEKDWGPVRQLTIPATFYTELFKTGGGYAFTTVGSLTSPPAIIAAVQNSGDGNLVLFGNEISLGFNFAVTSYSSLLTGKRILNVEYLYDFEDEQQFQGIDFTLAAAGSDSMDLGYPLGTTGTPIDELGFIRALPLGEYTPFYGTRTTYSTGATDMYPWNYASLARMDAATAIGTRVYLRLNSQLGNAGELGYLALRVTYCDETRVGVGGRRSNAGTQVSSSLQQPNTNGAFSIPILDPLTNTTAPTLTAGTNYVVTAQLGYMADYTYAFDSPYSMGALHQLYELATPGIRGVNVARPANLIGEEVETTATDNIPAISLHTSSGVVADTHGYYRQIVAPVYTGVNASQTIVNAAAGVGSTYSLARFFARRRGTTSSPLGLRMQASPTTTAQITSDEFDALDEIADGWKQVDLTFTTNLPTFTTSGTSTVEFFSSTSSGTRWEVLGARAPSITGLVPTEIGPNDWLAPTTYGGSTAVATWDQGSGTSTIDFRGDLTIMFASMPQVTGLTITQSLLEVDVTDECDQAPGGIPTGVYYHQLSWGATPAITGFGGYELQRQDPWTGWQTIMLASSVAVTGFSDFEARVGVQSDYRIRACHELDFCGPWSSTVSATIPTPGVTGTNVDSSLLIFTSNSRQDGSDVLAYSEIFDGTPAETFTFLEASGVTLQPMYNRDYQVAYHGTERGGESFSRVILTNNAAVSLINFEQGFQALRDLAWDSVPYVCVRDNHGSRWLANVTVPTGTIQPPGNSLQFAGITITEVTATAYPVDPA